MNQEELRDRTKKFALRIIKLVESMPNTITGRAIGNQLVRSGTSVAANYRAACRGRSKAEFNAKLHIALEEGDESLFWLEILDDAQIFPHGKLENIIADANELTAIFARAYKTAKDN